MSKQSNFSVEIQAEIQEVYNLLSESYNSDAFPASQLIIGLKALGFEIPSEKSITRSTQTAPITFSEFNTLLIPYFEKSCWCKEGLTKAFAVFDNDNTGIIDSTEIKRVFVKMGENLKETEIEEQMHENDSAHKGPIKIEDFLKIIFPAESGMQVVE